MITTGKFIGMTLGTFFAAWALVVVLGLIAAYPLMCLWNWLLTDLFNLSSITFWQAWGLWVLAGMLTRGIALVIRND